MSNEFAEATLYKIATGTYTPEELATFLKALEALDEAAYIQVYNRLYEIVAQQAPGTINEDLKVPILPKRTSIPIIKWLAAAAVLLATGGIVFWFTLKNKTEQPDPVETTKTTTPVDAAPGGNHATLTLSGGTVIVLDQANDGDLAHQGNARIVKSNNGQVTYLPTTAASTTIEYNTISTPRAGQYHIVLPDGTHVWLNAASSLRFPTAFTTKTREVTLSGEGYFEVVHDKTKPFYVTRGDMQVEVLGTHFNVNVYEDEEVAKVTLLEGRVRVVKHETGIEKSVVLRPGEQAIAAAGPLTTDHSPLTVDHSPEIEKAIAWKDGFFEFNNMALPAIMRQISRWYDVDVGLEATYPDKRFGGRISRKLNMASIISMLETYGVHFKMENKKLIVVQ